MRDAEEWAREWLGDSTEVYTDEVTALITAARREGAEDMRERAEKACDVDAPPLKKQAWFMGFRTARNGCIRRIRALPLPGDE